MRAFWTLLGPYILLLMRRASASPPNASCPAGGTLVTDSRAAPGRLGVQRVRAGDAGGGLCSCRRARKRTMNSPHQPVEGGRQCASPVGGVVGGDFGVQTLAGSPCPPAFPALAFGPCSLRKSRKRVGAPRRHVARLLLFTAYVREGSSQITPWAWRARLRKRRPACLCCALRCCASVGLGYPYVVRKILHSHASEINYIRKPGPAAGGRNNLDGLSQPFDELSLFIGLKGSLSSGSVDRNVTLGDRSKIADMRVATLYAGARLWCRVTVAEVFSDIEGSSTSLIRHRAYSRR
ncbi:hypothetical protein BCR34DRAFT_592594 [Clohesyomyces aquaticus]|uniref:Uncharacterized protein n=1 Tax=Clohesyomyces aquaticus TaxID=1231657 RepID=A0A1Y1YQU0_9PLEO|nr:hypothetical protein BCR34DRAFT_592594 [Clohesyomyces aquaticus]